MLHLEINNAAWSAGLSGKNSSLTFYLLYGGFQMVRIDVARRCMHERRCEALNICAASDEMEHDVQV